MLGASALTQRGPARSQVDGCGRPWPQRGAQSSLFCMVLADTDFSRNATPIQTGIWVVLCSSNLTGRFVLFCTHHLRLWPRYWPALTAAWRLLIVPKISF